MSRDITFIPLGGGQSVGASCYYLQIGDTKVILDAGTVMKEGMEFEPKFHSLLTSPFLQSMNQISQIFISHAHADHVGYLLRLMKQSTYANVCMTEITKTLAEYQLYDRMFIGNNVQNEKERLAAKSLFDRITPVSFMKTMDFGSYKVTFYPAGHIPGAMMMLFQIGRRKILYTGDYSLNDTALTQGRTIPEENIDTVILCGLHAKHPDYRKNPEAAFKQTDYILRAVKKDGRSVLCQIPQLSKGVEFLKILNDWNIYGVPIYLDPSVMNMVQKMEQLSVPILNQYNKIMGMTKPEEPHIYLTSCRNRRWEWQYQTVKVDFSLHEDFEEMKLFLRKINPRQAVVVHCEKEHSVFEHTIEQEMMSDGESRTQFIFAEEGEIYKL